MQVGYQITIKVAFNKVSLFVLAAVIRTKQLLIGCFGRVYLGNGSYGRPVPLDDAYGIDTMVANDVLFLYGNNAAVVNFQ